MALKRLNPAGHRPADAVQVLWGEGELRGGRTSEKKPSSRSLWVSVLSQTHVCLLPQPEGDWPEQGGATAFSIKILLNYTLSKAMVLLPQH